MGICNCSTYEDEPERPNTDRSPTPRPSVESNLANFSSAQQNNISTQQSSSSGTSYISSGERRNGFPPESTSTTPDTAEGSNICGTLLHCILSLPHLVTACCHCTCNALCKAMAICRNYLAQDQRGVFPLL